MEGKILHQYNSIMQFFTRNLRNVQVEENFNSLGELEIPPVALMEFTANALSDTASHGSSKVGRTQLIEGARILGTDSRAGRTSPGRLFSPLWGSRRGINQQESMAGLAGHSLLTASFMDVAIGINETESA